MKNHDPRAVHAKIAGKTHSKFTFGRERLSRKKRVSVVPDKKQKERNKRGEKSGEDEKMQKRE